MKPLVSIIIPVYQVSDCVEQCMKSVMAQSYTEIECVIVDDATLDDSIVKCERLIQAYEGPIRFRILHHEKIRGLSAARNTGLDASTGDYVYFLDSDDDITPDCIGKLGACVIEDDAVEMVQGNYVRTGDAKDYYGKSDTCRIVSNEEARQQFLYRKLNYTVWNKLLKRSFVIEHRLYNKEGIINEDLLWTFYLIKHLSNACLCKDITYYYRYRPDSIMVSGSKKKKGQAYASIYEEMLQHLTLGKEKSDLTLFLSTFCSVLANYLRSVFELKPVLRLYQRQARCHGAWTVYLTLVTVGTVCRFTNPYGLMAWFNNLRRR